MTLNFLPLCFYLFLFIFPCSKHSLIYAWIVQEDSVWVFVIYLMLRLLLSSFKFLLTYFIDLNLLKSYNQTKLNKGLIELIY